MAQGSARTPMVFDRAFLTDVADVTQVVLVRHGEQQLPDPHMTTTGDIIDPPLSSRGQRQAELVGMRFSTEKVDAVYTSNLRRAMDTGAQIARHHRLTPTVIDDLREVEVFRNIPNDRTAAGFLGEGLMAGIRERMLRERSWDVYPHSESSAEFRKRTVNAIEGIIATHEGQRVVIACHGGVINAYIGHIIRSPYDMFFRPAHTSVSIVYAGDGIRAVQSLNDYHHLATAEGSFVSH